VKLWSINEAAAETGRDRRFLSKVLGSVPPDGRLNKKHPGWRLRTILDAVSRHERGGGDSAAIDNVEAVWSDLRRGFTSLEREPDINARRVMVQDTVAPLVKELESALNSLWHTDEDHLVFGPCRDRMIATAISELARLCEAKLQDTPTGLALVVP
jgi:hypothetical protein